MIHAQNGCGIIKAPPPTTPGSRLAFVCLDVDVLFFSGRTLEEEVAACVLGGHGIPAEVGLAAFERLRDRGLISEPSPSAKVLSDSLREPLTLEGRQIVYRFWSQKARYLSATLKELRERPVPLNSARVLRDYLLQLPGIGPKTAFWIVRSWLGSNEGANSGYPRLSELAN